MTKDKGTIVFFASLLSQPRCIKRVTTLIEAGFNCIVYGYNRGNYDVNNYPQKAKVHNLGCLENGEYVNKFKKVFKDVRKVIKLHNSSTLFYSFGFAPAFFLFLFNRRYIYELSDVWYVYPKFDKIRFLLKKIDKQIIRHSIFTLMTSGGFVRYFKISNSKILVQPNRISPYFLNKERSLQSPTSNLSFGFVGSIRYKNIFRFADVIGEFYPDYSFNFFGGCDKTTLEKITSFEKKYDNIKYWGKFRSPEDLEGIYKKIDLVVACYDNDSLNEQIAEPNKLYEALYFGKPIIVSDGTYLSERVRELKCGYIIDASNSENIKNFINKLTIDSVKSISITEHNISTLEIIDNSETLVGWVNNSF